MISEQRVPELIMQALDRVKNSDSVYETLELNGKTVVLGVGGPFDSIAFTAFAVDLEEMIEEETGKEYMLQVEEIFALQNGKPDVTADEIAKHVTKLLNEKYSHGT